MAVKRRKASLEDENVVKEVEQSFLEKRENARKQLLADVRKNLDGRGIESAEYRTIERLSSGILVVDLAIGGGWGKGRTSLLKGKESSGKTFIVLASIADAQKRSLFTNQYLWECEREEDRVPNKCLYIDAEGTFDSIWAERLGVDTRALDLQTPATTEEAMDVTQSAIMSRVYDLIVVDSIAGMCPKAEFEASAFDQQQGIGARAINKMLRKIQGAVNHLNNKMERLPTILLINQLRQKTGVLFGSNITMPGGEGQKFSASVVVDMGAGKMTYFDKEKTKPRWVELSFEVKKNKTAVNGLSGSFIVFMCDDEEHGYKLGEIYEHRHAFKMAEELGVLKKVDDDDGGYEAMGERFRVQQDFKDKYIDDDRNFLLLKRAIVAAKYPKG